MNNIRIIYLYILSFISLAIIIVGTALFANNLTLYFYPDSYIFFDDINSNSNCYDYNYNNNSFNNIKREKEKEKRQLIERENYKNNKIKDSIVSAVVVLIGFILYKYHWGTIKKEITE